jgi:hypothetical protein
VKLTGGVAQLPAGAVIDLLFSGVGSAQLWQSAQQVNSGTNTYSLIGQNPSNSTKSSFIDTTDATEKAANTRLPIIVTFDKTGALENLYIRGPAVPPSSGSGSKSVQLQAIRLTSPIHFLVGKREKLGTLTSNAAEQNWTDLENIWVSINPQTGLVTTAEVAAASPTSTTLQQELQDARKYAQAAQTMGGR